MHPFILPFIDSTTPHTIHSEISFAATLGEGVCRQLRDQHGGFGDCRVHKPLRVALLLQDFWWQIKVTKRRSGMFITLVPNPYLIGSRNEVSLQLLVDKVGRWKDKEVSVLGAGRVRDVMGSFSSPSSHPSTNTSSRLQ
ncbi:hypothetical protein D8674_020357 [Pyrus ussuriensis x Pyrus communis]|uniref:Uncharacterized protein n=1 Tax=Pyrus ussuriensis x Pyrus communis TaxID=2448454 RepID=A0A5N5HFF3_9ROSA|nr:hypothetical protein D8674_020357 [Pyrus ussuriensis x Pyrus communis]